MIVALQLLLVAWLPGAVLLRVPVGKRSTRALLSAEERLFWSVVISVLLSSMVGLGLALGGWYTLSRLLWINAGVTLAVVGIVRGRLRLGPSAARPTATVLLPLALLVAGAWMFFRVPPAEYIMGGRDPGVYMNEGIRIAQRGGVVVPDDTASSVPPAFRDLFFPQTDRQGFYSTRFMGFFLLDPASGTVVGQFPHGFPVWVAIGYGISGLTGARMVPGLFALLGLLAVYFAGARIVGRAAGLAGSALLATHVAQLWYSRYPNAEILLQPLVFAGLLGYVRSVRDDDRFFAPVSALLFVLGAFTHLSGTIVALCVAAAAVLDVAARHQRVRLSFWIPLTGGTASAAVYLWRFIPPYFDVPLGFVRTLAPAQMAALAGAAIVSVVALRRLRAMPTIAREGWIAGVLSAAVWTLAIYAYFFRTAGGSLAPHDADSLRTFTSFYLSPYGLGAALFGFTVLAWTFGERSMFLALMAAFSVFSFHKIRIVPEHFWAARRFLALVLPGALLLLGAAAFTNLQSTSIAWLDRGRVRMIRYSVGLGLVLLIGQRFLLASQPILHHVEYAGLIPQLEQIASMYGDDDLVLFESRGSSDAHVLALPLGYVYAKNVLVFSAMTPPRESTREFITWARTKYRHVYYVGSAGNGIDLLSRSMSLGGIRGKRFQIPEYESALNAYPRRVKNKEFDLVFYEFLGQPVAEGPIDLDVGGTDDAYVQGFHAKEQSSAGFSYRWTRDESTVAVVGLGARQRQLTLWFGAGGRPPAAGAANVAVSLENTPLGTVTVGDALAPYRFEIPPDLAARMTRTDGALRLRISTNPWNPAKTIGGGDTRDIGVMVDRVEIR